MADRSRFASSGLPELLGAVVVAEFLLLRTGTRTLIHIPGLGRFETPIRVLSEVGRFFYYLAIVLLVVTVAWMALSRIRSTAKTDRITGYLIVLFLGVAVAGRAGLWPWVMVGWALLALLAAVTTLTWRGLRSVPIGLFVLSSVAASWGVLGQSGGGLSGSTVDLAVVSSEMLLVLAAVTSPLLIGEPLTAPALIAGAMATAVSTGGFASAGSTLSIMILWNVGVPGWLPGIAYGLAIGALTASVWLSVSSGRRAIAVVVLLLVAGGVGVISTYQTGLVLAAVLIFNEANRFAEPASSRMETALVDRQALGREPVGTALQ